MCCFKVLKLVTFFQNTGLNPTTGVVQQKQGQKSCFFPKIKKPIAWFFCFKFSLFFDRRNDTLN